MDFWNIRNVFHFVKVRRGQRCKYADDPNDANDQGGFAMGQLVAHGVQHHLALFKADSHQGVDRGRKSRHLCEGTDFAHRTCHVPPLGDASVELKGSEN